METDDKKLTNKKAWYVATELGTLATKLDTVATKLGTVATKPSLCC